MSQQRRLDCLIIGYNDLEMTFNDLATMPPDSPERRVFARDHVRIDAGRMSYMDVINHYANTSSRTPGGSDDGYYHVGEVGSLAAIYLSNFLQRAGMTARYVSLFQPERETVLDILRNERPHTVAITTTFYELPKPVVYVCNFIRQHSPDTRIVVGGPLIENLIDDLDEPGLQAAFRAMGADAYVREGQGEATLARVVHALKNGGPLASIPNLFLPSGDSYSFTGAQPENNSLDECAIDWDRFSDDELGQTVQMRTARSCAFACSFCDYPVRVGALTLASVETVERELQKLSRRGVKNVVFIDDTFNVPIPRFRELCRMMIRNKFDFEWYSYFRCSQIKDDLTFDLMKESGCRAVFLGIESGDPTVLENMNKKAQAEQYRHGLAQLHKRGILTFASFIVGFPGETQQTVQNTIDFINDTQPVLYRAEPWYYVQRSPIQKEREKYALTGTGYAWTHATMNIKEACDGADAIFANVKGSLWCPQYNFSFWALPYLFGKGMTTEQVIDFHARCHKVLRFNHVDDPAARASTGADEATASLGALCSSFNLTPPRYRYRSANA
jgi:p-methyltransferase